MRCIACNRGLSDYEATRKHSITNEFIDMCNECYFEIEETIASIEREDLMHPDDEPELHTGPVCTEFNGS